MNQTMANKNQDNRPEWAKRVSEYDVVPDDAVYTENESWQGVEARLRKANRTSKRRIYLHWAAASILLLIISFPLMTNKRNGMHHIEYEISSVKPSDKKIIIVPEIKIDSQKAMVNNDSPNLNQVLQIETNKPFPKKSPGYDIAHLDKNDDMFRGSNDSSGPNKTIVASNKPLDTSVENKDAEIVHINNINSGTPAIQYDETKIRRFLRKYDVDAPAKNSAAGSSNTSPFNNHVN